MLHFPYNQPPSKANGCVLTIRNQFPTFLHWNFFLLYMDYLIYVHVYICVIFLFQAQLHVETMYVRTCVAGVY